MKTTILVLFVLLQSARAQDSPLPKAFEVASIRPDQSEDRGSSSQNMTPGGRLVERNVSPKMLIVSAFGVAGFQIQGGPGWMDTDRYDIQAKADTPGQLSVDELKEPLQNLLADRFALKYHRETKELSEYSLVVAKTGPKLTLNTGDDHGSTEVHRQSGHVTIAVRKTSMVHCAMILAGQLGRTVVDNTGLTGEYDFTLEWSPEPTPDSSDPSIIAALQEQLGLKLESTKGPVEVIVIDHLEKPSED